MSERLRVLSAIGGAPLAAPDTPMANGVVRLIAIRGAVLLPRNPMTISWRRFQWDCFNQCPGDACAFDNQW